MLGLACASCLCTLPATVCAYDYTASAWIFGVLCHLIVEGAAAPVSRKEWELWECALVDFAHPMQGSVRLEIISNPEIITTCNCVTINWNHNHHLHLGTSLLPHKQTTSSFAPLYSTDFGAYSSLQTRFTCDV